MFSVTPAINTRALKQIFRHMVLKTFLAKGKINPDVNALMDKWRHTGFNVYCGPRILPLQKIYEVDPLTCSKCQGLMRIIAFIENEDVIKKILKHLGLREIKWMTT